MTKKLTESRVYSALEVAKICGVVNQTAINWIKAGHLKAFQTPGGQYRVYPKDLVEFMISRSMDVPETLQKECPELLSEELKIMIVDDDKGLNTVISKFIVKNHPEVTMFQAFDGFEAGALMSREKPGFVILDLDLPGVDGFSLCQKIDTDESFGFPEILVITALNDENLEERLNTLGVKHFLRKPLRFELIEEYVSGWLKS